MFLGVLHQLSLMCTPPRTPTDAYRPYNRHRTSRVSFHETDIHAVYELGALDASADYPRFRHAEFVVFRYTQGHLMCPQQSPLPLKPPT